MTKPPKARVRHSFERAAATYDSAAAVQRRICDRLLAGLPELAPARLLDAGCGTGYALPLLQARFPAAQALALDLSAAMLGRITTPSIRLVGDLEQLPLADASLDLYWSSLAVQWCELPAVLRESLRTLRPGGCLALASLGPQTFGELRHAFAEVDEHAHTLPFHSPEEVAEITAAVGLAAVDVRRHREIAYYVDFRSLLRAVKAVGANQLGSGRRPGLLSRAGFARAETALETLRTPAGLPLTYDVITLYARK